jgi:hypothetical protein
LDWDAKWEQVDSESNFVLVFVDEDKDEYLFNGAAINISVRADSKVQPDDIGNSFERTDR